MGGDDQQRSEPHLRSVAVPEGAVPSQSAADFSLSRTAEPRAPRSNLADGNSHGSGGKFCCGALHQANADIGSLIRAGYSR
jgi:hypothetical protein